MTQTPNNPIELILFDLGRVMIRLAGDRPAAAKAAGVELPELNEAAWSVWAEHRHAHETGKVSYETFFERIAPVSGLTHDEHRRIYEGWLRGPFPGIVEFVEDLLDTGVQLGCLSNTNDLHWSMMHATEGEHALPLHRLHHRFASHLVGHVKPDAAIYAHAEEQTGVPAENILFFDDLPENIHAAQARGWQGCIIADDGDSVSQMRTYLLNRGVLA